MYLSAVSEGPPGPSQRERLLNHTDPILNGDLQARAGWGPSPSFTLQASWSMPLYQLESTELLLHFRIELESTELLLME